MKQFFKIVAFNIDCGIEESVVIGWISAERITVEKIQKNLQDLNPKTELVWEECRRGVSEETFLNCYRTFSDEEDSASGFRIFTEEVEE